MTKSSDHVFWVMMKVQLILLFLGLAFGRVEGDLHKDSVPQAIEKQVRDGHLLILGSFIGTAVKRMAPKQIFTQYSFQVKEFLELDGKTRPRSSLIDVHFEGGHWSGMNHQSEQLPKLEVGSSYILFLNKGKFNNFYPVAPPLIFEIQDTRGEKKLGLVSKDYFTPIPFEDFRRTIRSMTGKRLNKKSLDKFVYKSDNDKQSNRSPSSLNLDEGNEDSQVLWPYFFLFVVLPMAFKLRRTR